MNNVWTNGLGFPRLRAGLVIATCVLANALVARPLTAQQVLEEGQETEGVRTVSLDEALKIALRRNPSLDQARSSVELTEFDRLNAYGSFLPNINLTYGYSNASTGRLDPTGQSITRTSYSSTLGASYDLFTGLRRQSTLKSARLGVAAENARLRQSEYQIIHDVKQAYFNAIASRELVNVQRETVQRQIDQLNFVQQQVDLGRATRSDLLRSQVDLNNAKLDLLNAENAARASTFQLGEVLGIEERVAPVAEATLETEPFNLSREQLLRRALAGAPSVTSAVASARAANASVGSARSAYLPSLTFNGGWAWQDAGFPPSNRSWSLSLRGSYPLFNGFQRESAIYRAQAQANQAHAQERAARLAVRKDVDAAYSQIRSAEAAISLAEQSVELSQESLRVIQERYRLGLATILDLEQAQITLSQSQVDLINRRFDYQIGLAQLESLLGQDLKGRGGR
ncbi:MAG: TolC family protein [Gemmatimonadota bacterium]